LRARARAARSSTGAVRALALLLATALFAGCSTPAQKKAASVYGPAQSVLEVVSMLRRHVPDDTYRFAPATDFTGRNVYRSSLLRLENIERLHAESLKAGHMDAVIAFAKARALERLRAYDLAVTYYVFAAERDEILREEALRSSAICAELAEIVSVGIDLMDPIPAETASPAFDLDTNQVVAGLDLRISLLTDLLDQTRAEKEPHFGFVIREEIERADVTRARYFAALRSVLSDGSVIAVSESQRVIMRHAPSKNRNLHLISLADLYADLATEYVQANPPESLRFDPPRFRELVDAASRIYQSVAIQDGTPEKIEAARRFEAFLAFTLKVDRDRFTP
jgi:hypothetical protein